MKEFLYKLRPTLGFDKKSKPHAVSAIITERETPKINRRLELRARNSVLKRWKRRHGFTTRVPAVTYAQFIKEYQQFMKGGKNEIQTSA